MELGLEGRSVLVTGASKGIGRAVAGAFAAEGANLHIVSRTEVDLERAAAEIREAHAVEVVVHAADLSASESIGWLRSRTGDVDVLVNNAGAIPGGELAAVDEARWREGWDLKVFGYINMTRAYGAAMQARGRGVIVNVIGLAGEKPDANYVAGTAGNASLMAFTRATGSYSLEHGVRIVAVNPGAVETERLVGLLKTKARAELGTEDRWREYLSRLPMGRAAFPREVADLVVFLASERASYVSGTVVSLDGGHASRGGSF